jgi:uncharacterized protein with HEPN domain
MTQRDTTLTLGQMLDAARRAVAITSGRTREELDTDELLDLAVVRILEILGEAANRVPKDDQVRYPDIAWSEIVSMRNRLIHGYDNVDLDVVWQVVTEDVPALVAELERIMASEDAHTDDQVS